MRPADVDETTFPDEPPADYVLRVAAAKARRVLADVAAEDSLIVAADTTVVAAGEILGKPVDDDDAVRMLRLLSGQVHQVLTGVVVLSAAAAAEEVIATRVSVRALTNAEIAWYVATREPDGKAGAYAIQGIGARFVESIEGSWSNVVGLPVAAVDRMIRGLRP